VAPCFRNVRDTSPPSLSVFTFDGGGGGGSGGAGKRRCDGRLIIHAGGIDYHWLQSAAAA